VRHTFYPFASMLVAPLGALVLVMLARPFYLRTETPRFPWKVWAVLTVVLFALQMLGISQLAPRLLEK